LPLPFIGDLSNAPGKRKGEVREHDQREIS
jgi:hypothetical protein